MNARDDDNASLKAGDRSGNTPFSRLRRGRPGQSGESSRPIQARIFGGAARSPFWGPRIAQRIFLGYVMPLVVLLALGLALPILLWSYLGRAKADLDERTAMAAEAASMRTAAQNSENQATNFLRYHDKQFEDQFLEARDSYHLMLRDLDDYAERRQNPDLTYATDAAAHAYNQWLHRNVNPPFRLAQMYPQPGPTAANVAAEAHLAYAPVDKAFTSLVARMEAYRNAERPVARAASVLRTIAAVVTPLCALLLSLLIGRSLALGITRPLEVLIAATEKLEQGEEDGSGLLLLDDVLENEVDGADDEIGDLERAFQRMARTIQQREAVLRTQNEAFGALIRRIEAVLNATNDGILLIDRAGGFSLVNRRLSEIFDLPIEDLQDHTWMQAGSLLLARFRNKAVVRERFRTILEDAESTTDETFDIDGPGALRSLRIYSAPVRGGDSLTESGAEDDLLGRIFVFRDVTRETMVDRMKTEFVSTVSHELRTPLTAIKGYVDLMVNGQTGPLTPLQTEFLTLVQTSTHRLTLLINDMLDISRIESGRIEMRIESVDYLTLIRQAVRMMQQEADSREITLRVEVDHRPDDSEAESKFPAVLGDADRITQVLTNFLSNGIKYTPRGGEVTVEVEFEDEFVTTCVADTGIGIDAADQRKLFQKFFRADNSTTREVGGTGLGLAITKAILEKLNGSVWVDSERGKGSRFYFTLPTIQSLKSDQAGGESDENVAARNGGAAVGAPAAVSRLILSIDGDVSLLHRIGHELRRVGYVTSNAANTADALRRARDLRPDLITLNLLTPNMDAAATLRALHENPATSSIPVVLVAPQVVGGRTELSDTIEYLPPDFGGADWETLLSGPLGRTLAQAREARTVVVLVGAEERFAAACAALGRTAPDLLTLTFPSDQEADRALLGDKPPALIVWDAAAAGGPAAAGGYLQRLRRRFPNARTPLLLLTEEDPARAGAYPLTPFAGGAVPIEDLGQALRALLNNGEPAGQVRSAENTASAAR